MPGPDDFLIGRDQIPGSCPNGPGPCYCTGRCRQSPYIGDPMPSWPTMPPLPPVDPEMVKKVKEQVEKMVAAYEAERQTMVVTITVDKALIEQDREKALALMQVEAMAQVRKAFNERYPKED